MLWLSSWVLLATLVGVSVQQCSVEDFNVFTFVEDAEIPQAEVTDSIRTIEAFYYNCLSSSQTVGLYLTMTLSVLFTKESTPNVTNEARYNAECFRGLWSMSGDSIATALRDNNTRINCSSCLDQSVNDYQCSRK